MIANGEGNGLAQLVDYKKHHIYHFNHSTVTQIYKVYLINLVQKANKNKISVINIKGKSNQIM